MANSGTGAVHRQLGRLAESGWISVLPVGNQKYYQANRDCPAFDELHGLILKTVGLVEPIRRALAKRRSDVHAAFIYGSVARGDDRADSDIDLMVISDRLTFPEIYDSLQPVERRLGRTINPNVMGRAEWIAKRAKADSFAARISAQPRLFIVGRDDDLART